MQRGCDTVFALGTVLYVRFCIRRNEVYTKLVLCSWLNGFQRLERIVSLSSRVKMCPKDAQLLSAICQKTRNLWRKAGRSPNLVRDTESEVGVHHTTKSQFSLTQSTKSGSLHSAHTGSGGPSLRSEHWGCYLRCEAYHSPANCERRHKERVDHNFTFPYIFMDRSRWPHGLNCGSVATCLLGLWVRIPRGHECSSVLSIECCQVEVSASGRSLV